MQHGLTLWNKLSLFLLGDGDKIQSPIFMILKFILHERIKLLLVAFAAFLQAMSLGKQVQTRSRLAIYPGLLLVHRLFFIGKDSTR